MAAAAWQPASRHGGHSGRGRMAGGLTVNYRRRHSGSVVLRDTGTDSAESSAGRQPQSGRDSDSSHRDES